MLLSACGGGDDDGGGAAGGGGDGGSFSVYIGEPENPLVPGNTNETEGGQIVDSLFTGLVEYDNETNEAVYTGVRSEEHTSELQSRQYLVCRLLLEKKKKNIAVVLCRTHK